MNDHSNTSPIELANQLYKLRGEILMLQKENEHLRDSLLVAEEREESGETIYIGTISKNLFHLPSCKWMQGLPRHCIVSWHSHGEAVRAGRKPCKTCRS